MVPPTSIGTTWLSSPPAGKVSVSSPALAGRCVEAIRARCRKARRDPVEIDCGQSFALLLTDDAARVEDALGARRQGPSEHRAQARVALENEPEEEAVRASILAGSPDQVLAQLRRYIDAGINHFILQTPPPFDFEMLGRFSEEIIPALKREFSDK